jgi:hypothetical protein
MFLELRLHFKEFAEAKTGYYSFGPYKTSDAEKANEKLWASKNPKGALMSFNLDTRFANAFFRNGTYLIYEKFGDVQVTCATETDIVFSTVETKKGGTHPVNGNRGFGLKDSGDGTMTFYSKAADRESDFKMNWSADVFAKGQEFWEVFYDAMVEYLNGQNLKAKKHLDNHQVVKYQPPLKIN